MRLLRFTPALALFVASGLLAWSNFSPARARTDAPETVHQLAAEQEDREYRLPDDEMIPAGIHAMADPADVADWGHAVIGVPDAWQTTKGAGAVVAVLDTGIDHGHRDLKNQIQASKNFTSSRSGDNDVNGHGSHCAGVVAAEENAVGMVGVAPQAKLLSGKVLGDNGAGASTWIAAGIDWAVAQKADVISMSLGASSPDNIIGAAVKRAQAAGVIVVAAAGNAGPRENSAGWPGSFEGVVCVAACDKSKAIASFSSRGRSVVVAAPGVNVRSCYPGDRFATMSGTSMATPYVAGCAALYVSHCKTKGIKYTPADFATALQKTCADLPPTGRDTASGWGLVQPAKLFPAPPVPPSDPMIPPMPKPPEVGGDSVVITPPDNMPITVAGRKVKRILLELEPEKKP